MALCSGSKPSRSACGSCGQESHPACPHHFFGDELSCRLFTLQLVAQGTDCYCTFLCQTACWGTGLPCLCCLDVKQVCVLGLVRAHTNVHLLKVDTPGGGKHVGARKLLVMQHPCSSLACACSEEPLDEPGLLVGAADPHSAPPSEGSSNEFFYAAALPSQQASVREAVPVPGLEQPLAIPVVAGSAAADEAVANPVWNKPVAVGGSGAAEAPSASAAAQEWAWPAGFGDLSDSAVRPRLEVQPALPAVQEAQAEEHPEVATPPAPAHFGDLSDSAVWPRLEVQPAVPAVWEAQAEEHSEAATPPAPAQAQQPAAEEGEQWSPSFCVAILLAKARQPPAEEGPWSFL